MKWGVCTGEQPKQIRGGQALLLLGSDRRTPTITERARREAVMETAVPRGTRGPRSRSILGVATPAAMIYCSRGLPINVTPDLLKAHLPNTRLLQQPLPDLLVMGCSSSKQKDQRFADTFALDKHLLIVTPWDPLASLVGPVGRSKASFETPTGRKTIKPADYIRHIDAMRPDVAVVVSDRCSVTASSCRCKKAVSRTIEWAKACTAEARKRWGKASSADAKTPAPAEGSAPPPLLFGVIEGGSDPALRAFCAERVGAIEGLAGFAINGLASGLSSAEQLAILKSVTDKLPKSVPIVADGMGTPLRVLSGVAAGVDVFESGYPVRLSRLGQGCTFVLDPLARNDKNTTAQPTKINLWDLKYKLDPKPVLPGCTCYACSNHSRAYINHLLHAHEMLAQVLLQLHNIHHYSEFFRRIRSALRDNCFDRFRASFERLYLQPTGADDDDEIKAGKSDHKPVRSSDDGKREAVDKGRAVKRHRVAEN